MFPTYMKLLYFPWMQWMFMTFKQQNSQIQLSSAALWESATQWPSWFHSGSAFLTLDIWLLDPAGVSKVSHESWQTHTEHRNIYIYTYICIIMCVYIYIYTKIILEFRNYPRNRPKFLVGNAWFSHLKAVLLLGQNAERWTTWRKWGNDHEI